MTVHGFQGRKLLKHIIPPLILSYKFQCLFQGRERFLVLTFTVSILSLHFTTDDVTTRGPVSSLQRQQLLHEIMSESC